MMNPAMGIKYGWFLFPLRLLPVNRKKRMAEDAENKPSGCCSTSATGFPVAAIPERARNSRPPAARVIKQNCALKIIFSGKN